MALRSGLPIFYNSGFSFGFGTVVPELVAILLVVGIAVVLYWTFRSFWYTHQVLAGIFFGAVLANLLDRFVHGAVVDWLPIPLTNMHNNLADILIVGVLGYKILLDLRINHLPKESDET